MGSIIRFMAGIAVGRGTFVGAACMARNAGGASVGTGERITGLGVVYSSASPVSGGMAGGAILAEYTFMDIVLLVANATACRQLPARLSNNGREYSPVRARIDDTWNR